MEDTRSYLEMAFDRDGYFASHNRHVFAASMWLQSLIEVEANWPLAAQQIGTHLRALGGSPDHNEMQIEKAKDLIAPWLLTLSRNVPKSD